MKNMKKGPRGGRYKMVRWYKSKPKRAQLETLFGEEWHDPGILKSFLKETGLKDYRTKAQRRRGALAKRRKTK